MNLGPAASVCEYVAALYEAGSFPVLNSDSGLEMISPSIDSSPIAFKNDSTIGSLFLWAPGRVRGLLLMDTVGDSFHEIPGSSSYMFPNICNLKGHRDLKFHTFIGLYQIFLFSNTA